MPVTLERARGNLVEGPTLGVFDPQGEHKPGMGLQTLTDHPFLKKLVYDPASEAAGFNIPRVCFGTNAKEEQNNPLKIQAATIAVNLASAFVWVRNHGVLRDLTGVSLGLYAAVGFSGAVDGDASEIVYKTVSIAQRRSEIIDKVRKDMGQDYAMAAILGKNDDYIDDLTLNTNTHKAVDWGPFENRHGYTISGVKENIDYALEYAKGNRLIAKDLGVNMAGHSPYQEETVEQIREELKLYVTRDPSIRIYTNAPLADGSWVMKTKEDIIEHVPEQMKNTVQFRGLMEHIATLGIENVVQFGPDLSYRLARRFSENIGTNVLQVAASS